MTQEYEFVAREVHVCVWSLNSECIPAVFTIINRLNFITLLEHSFFTHHNRGHYWGGTPQGEPFTIEVYKPGKLL